MDRVAALSHPGRRRTKNEDAVLHMEAAEGWLLLAVADGVGGEQAGEVASAEAVRVLRAVFGEAVGERPDEQLRQALQDANDAIWHRAQESPRYRGMSTTTVAALARGRELWVANVGDSRGYAVESGVLRQVTEDHSLVAERVRDGEITDDEARHSPVRNIITRSVGSEPSVEVDVFGPIMLASGDRLLLCSDGLTDVLDDAEIERVAVGGMLARVAQELVDLANKRGGPDNISVVLYEAAGGDPAGARELQAALEPPDRYAIAGITS